MLNESSHRLQMSNQSKDFPHQQKKVGACHVCNFYQTTQTDILQDCDYKSLLQKSKYFYHTYLKKKTPRADFNINENIILKSDSHLISPCECPKLFHKSCLVNYCMINVTIQCPDCKKNYAIAFSDQNSKIQNKIKLIISFSILLIFHLGLIFIAFLFFSQFFEFKTKYEFWSYILGTLTLVINILTLPISYNLIISIKTDKKKIFNPFFEPGKNFDIKYGEKLYQFMKSKYNCEKEELIEKKINSKTYSDYIMKEENKKQQCIAESNKLFNSKHLGEKMFSMYGSETPEQMRKQIKEKKIYIKKESYLNSSDSREHEGISIRKIPYAKSSSNTNMIFLNKRSSEDDSDSFSSTSIKLKKKYSDNLEKRKSVLAIEDSKRNKSSKELKHVSHFVPINNLYKSKSPKKRNKFKLDEIEEEHTPQRTTPILSLKNKYSSGNLNEDQARKNDDNSFTPNMQIKLIPIDGKTFLNKKSLVNRSSSEKSILSKQNDQSKDLLILRENISIESYKHDDMFEDLKKTNSQIKH